MLTNKFELIQTAAVRANFTQAAMKKALEAIDGVDEATVSHEENRAVVTLSADVADEVLREAVEAKDYKVLSVE